MILRDVLGFSGAEVADALDTSPASVYSLLQRAHATIDERLPDRSQQATVRTLDDEQARTIVDRSAAPVRERDGVEHDLDRLPSAVPADDAGQSSCKRSVASGERLVR